NLLAVSQAEVRPGRAGIGGLVDTISNRQIGTMQTFAAGNIDNVGIGRRDFDGADGASRLAVEDGLPGAAKVVRLPYATVHRADVEDIRLAGHTGDSASASSAKRAHVAPLHLAEQAGIELLCVGQGSDSEK